MTVQARGTVARITVLVQIDEGAASDTEDHIRDRAEWAIDDALSSRFGEDPDVAAWRICGDWPDTPALELFNGDIEFARSAP